MCDIHQVLPQGHTHSPTQSHTYNAINVFALAKQPTALAKVTNYQGQPFSFFSLFFLDSRYQQNHIGRAHHQGCSLLTHSCELQWKYLGHTREYEVTLGKGWHKSRENNSLLWIEGTTTGWTPAFSVHEFIQLRSCEPKELLTSVFSSCGSPSEHHPVPSPPCYRCHSCQDCWIDSPELVQAVKWNISNGIVHITSCLHK